MIPCRFVVFNAEQTEGLNLPKWKAPEVTWDPNERAEKILKTSNAVIHHKLGNAAFYSPSACQEAIEIYGTRDLIEKTFKAGKSTADMSVVRSHREDTAEGRFIISFAAMTILSRLYALMKKSVTIADNKGNLKTLEPLAQDMS